MSRGRVVGLALGLLDELFSLTVMRPAWSPSSLCERSGPGCYGDGSGASGGASSSLREAS